MAWKERIIRFCYWGGSVKLASIITMVTCLVNLSFFNLQLGTYSILCICTTQNILFANRSSTWSLWVWLCQLFSRVCLHMSSKWYLKYFIWLLFVYKLGETAARWKMSSFWTNVMIYIVAQLAVFTLCIIGSIAVSKSGIGLKVGNAKFYFTGK